MAWQTNAVNVISGSSNYTRSGPATGPMAISGSNNNKTQYL
jgi:hypothetical protein